MAVVVQARPSGEVIGELGARRHGDNLGRHGAAALVVVALLAATGILTWLTSTSADRTETRLLSLQVRQAGTVLQLAAPAVIRPLATAAISALDGASPASAFDSHASQLVGPKAQFASMSLWRLSGASPSLLATVGSGQPVRSPAKAAAMFAAAKKATLAVSGLLSGRHRALVYAVATGSGASSYGVIAESRLPANSRVKTKPNASFSDLDFALYLGRHAVPSALIENNAPLPLSPPTATSVAPFGSSAITTVASANGFLDGALAQSLPLGIAIFGVVLAIVSAIVVDGLVRRRRQAEGLAAEVAHLYGEQRTIAETLQHALLPGELPALSPRGAEIATRYVAGVKGVEVGGDWYDVIPTPDGKVVLVVGDVSGRGLKAATVMASLRYALRAYVAQGDGPAEALSKLSGLLSVANDGYFATVLMAVADLEGHRCALVSAGHLPPLLLGPGGASFVEFPVGLPVGVRADAAYRVTTVEVPSGAVLVAYTDGLVERREEPIDEGLRRLRSSVGATGGSLEDFVSALLVRLEPGESDDTAVLALRFPG